MYQRGMPGFSGSDPPPGGSGSAMALRAQGHEDSLVVGSEYVLCIYAQERKSLYLKNV